MTDFALPESTHGLSARALGVLIKLLGMDLAGMSVERLAEHFPEGRDALRRACTELEQRGLLRRTLRPGHGAVWYVEL